MTDQSLEYDVESDCVDVLDKNEVYEEDEVTPTYATDLFVNRFRPRSLSDMKRPELSALEDIARQPCPPNMILYGSRHSGKKTALYAFLRDMYGPFETRCKHISFRVGKLISIPVFFSSYHIEIDILSFLSQVRTVLPPLVKKLSSTRGVLGNNIKILVIHHMESLETQTQHTLRRMIEMYADNCRFLFLTHRLNSITRPIQSRCVLIRVPSYTKNEIRTILGTVNRSLDTPVKDESIDRIMEMEWLTVKNALYQLEYEYHGLGKYERPIDKIMELVGMVTNPTVAIHNTFYKKIDSILYAFMFKNFDLYDLFYDIFRVVYPLIPSRYRIEYVKTLAELDVDMTRGIREINHIQTHVYYLIYLFKRIRTQASSPSGAKTTLKS